MRNILVWFIYILYLEMILKIALFNNAVFNTNIIYMIIFVIPIALLYRLITGLASPKINKVVSYVLVIATTIIFIAQLVYYKTYLSIFSVFSMGKANQLIDFIDTILKIIYRNIFVIILMIIPLIIFLIFNKRFMVYEKPKPKLTIILLISIVLMQIVGNITLKISKDELYSVKDLYYNTHSPTLSTNKLGLLTTMRLDFKRLLLGFDEKNKFEKIPIINEEDDPEIIEIEYNKLDIDFDELIKNESHQTLKDMHAYFRDSKATAKNDFTGMFKGKNLIVLLAESFDPIAIDEHLTPTLYKLYNEGFKFTNFYTPLFPVSTTDGEYITVTSLIPKEGLWSAHKSSGNYFPFVLGNSFKQIGYKTTAYHNHTATYYMRHLSHPNYGYDYYACGRGLDINCRQWPESDLEMINATYNSYIMREPFLTYYVTVSGHLRYTRLGNSMAYKNWSYVKNINYSEGVKAYMACHIELDKALASLIELLDKTNKLSNTVIALAADHYPYGLTLDEINEKSTYKRDEDFEKHRSHFLLWNSEIEPIEIDKLGSNIDVLPTLLNLFDIEYDSRLLMGKDLLSDSEGLVIFSNRSFITEKGRYNSITNKFVSSDGEAIDDEYIKRIQKIIYDKFYLSRQILETDYYRKVFK
ncbi:MAG: sulfatase-like hydrolase/transferase [Bacilli bacterium]|nr:sulfatase-like hydrolase/transferase [Bacilli bacterium]MDD4298120.1 sulfatase-like hydrolase/transferase [Bacilli bacterium]MDD4643623.1 sulfatase-like hydrolase/transferase [Bacilli bacterium]